MWHPELYNTRSWNSPRIPLVWEFIAKRAGSVLSEDRVLLTGEDRKTQDSMAQLSPHRQQSFLTWKWGMRGQKGLKNFSPGP